MGSKVFVRGLPWDFTYDTLEKTFSRFGKVLDAEVKLDYGGSSRGFGFITFAEEQVATQAIDAMHSKELGGKNISVQIAHTPPPLPSTSPTPLPLPSLTNTHSAENLFLSPQPSSSFLSILNTPAAPRKDP